MKKIKIAEIFYSLQGEGAYLGTPSVFLRTFGCNFKCQGFGMPRGQLSTERENVDPTKYNSYNELPLVHTGCDSYASWDPRFKKFSPMMTLDEIVEKIKSLLPYGQFSEDKHLIITGGEPLLTWQKAYPELLDRLCHEAELSYVTFETNGTQKLSAELIDYIDTAGLNVTFSISAKLPSSGEKMDDAIKPEVVESYIRTGGIEMPAYFKFVISNEDDYFDVQLALEMYWGWGVPRIPVYIMPAGGTTKLYDQNKKWVAELCMRHGWRYSPRLQVDLWKNVWGS